jgi:predicted RNase H-like HicB family nuclease
LVHQFDVIIERDEEAYYIASVPELPGCHTQARSLNEVTKRIREGIELCLEAAHPSAASSSSGFSAR